MPDFPNGPNNPGGLRRSKLGPGDHSTIVEYAGPNLWHVVMEDVSTTSRRDNTYQQRSIHCYVEWDGRQFIGYFDHMVQVTLGAYGAGARPVVYPVALNESTKRGIIAQLIPAFAEVWFDLDLRSWKDRVHDYMEASSQVRAMKNQQTMEQYYLDHPDEARMLQEALDSVPDSDPPSGPGDISGEED